MAWSNTRAWALMLGVTACGAPADGPELGDDPLQSDDDDRTDGEPPVEVIEIPMRPVTTADLYAVPTLEGGVLRFESSLTLALGEGYPREFVAVIPSAHFATCGPLRAALELGPLELGNDGSGTRIALDDDGALAIEVGREGTTSVRSRGTATLQEDGCETPSGTTLTLEFALDVQVRSAQDSEFSGPCDAQPWLIAPGAGQSANDFRWLRASLRDGGGPYSADNADRDAQVPMRLHGTFEAGHSTPESLQTWIPPSMPGPVEIEPAFGPSALVEIVDATAITGVDVRFEIAGTAGGGFVIDDGAEYGPGYGRSANRAIPTIQAVQVGDRPLCSAPAAEWFDLRTLTPGVCEVIPHDGDFLYTGDPSGHAGHLLRDGTCTLQMTSPAGDHTVSATFRDIEGLHDF